MIRPIRYLHLAILLIVFSLFVFPLRAASALTDEPVSSGFPTLESFIRQVSNGQADELRGVYVEAVLNASVVQQPDGNKEFISPRDNVVTQYGEAARLGSIGLMAHNYLAGEYFSSLAVGQKVSLVYGDGRVAAFTVTRLLRYRAAEPASPASRFIDLATGSNLSASELFSAIYNRPGEVVLQTCISSGHAWNWGRLFVIAQPAPIPGP